MRFTNEYKAEVLSQGIDKLEKKLRWQATRAIEDNRDFRQREKYLRLLDFDDFRCARNLNQARYKRAHNLYGRIRSMLALVEYDVYFGTMTFNDEALKLSYETRRRYVSRHLGSFSSNFVANVDYGAKNKREHYHCLVAVPKGQTPKDWPYGFCDWKKAKNSDTDIKKMGKYIAKLTNHAIKETTQNRRLIYSRRKNG